MKKNYFEHDITVRFMDQYYAKGKDWQWFIDVVEKDFEFEDIVSWEDYVHKCWLWLQAYSFVEKIIEVGYEQIDINVLIVKDMVSVALFRQGVISVDEVMGRLTTNYGKVFFWVVWATKLENQENDITSIYDNDLFTMHNLWMFRNLTSLELYYDDLMDYGEKISVKNIE